MKIGIAGAGFMGVTHAAGWSAAGAQLTAIVAETAQEAAPLAAQYGLKIYANYADMLPEVDVVDICTPTHLHHPMVLQAALAHKDIVCEKPLARTAAEAQEMISACRQAGVRLLVAHVVRYFPEYALARAVVLEGQIGRLGVVRLHRGSYRPKKPVGNWFLDEAKSGGLILDLMIHDFDYARWIAGEVVSVFAKKISTNHPGAPIDYGLVILTHQSGALSHIAGAWAYPPPTFRTSLEIFGDAGLIQYDSAETAPILNLIRSSGDAPDVALPSSPVSESPYTTQIKEFYHALSTGAPARIQAEDGLAAVQIAEAALQSARSGRAVLVAPLSEVQS